MILTERNNLQGISTPDGVTNTRIRLAGSGESAFLGYHEDTTMCSFLPGATSRAHHAQQSRHCWCAQPETT